MKIQNVAVTGPNGTLGPAVIKNLKDAGFNITLLTRNPQKSFDKTTKSVQVNYASVNDLEAILRPLNIDAMVCLINRDQLQSQINLINACVAAGIPHIIPPSFGTDLRSPAFKNRPPWKEKQAMEDYLNARAREGSITFTIINTGMFLDWALEANVFMNLKDDQPIRIFDGGNTKLSATVLDDIGKAVATALKKRDQLINKYCSIHSAVLTQNQLLGYVRELYPERKFKTMDLDTLEMVQLTEERLKNGAEKNPATMRAYILRETFGTGANLFKEVDNEALGVEEWDEERLKSLLAKVIDGK